MELDVVFIKPNFDMVDVEKLVFDLYGFNVIEMKPLESYDDTNVYIHVDANIHHNKFLTKRNTNGYTLKILNSQNTISQPIELQHRIMKKISDSGIKTIVPILNIYGEESSIQSLPASQGGKDNFMVRLFNFMPGIPYKAINVTPALAYEVGCYAGKIDQSLKNIQKENEMAYNVWNMAVIPDLLPCLHCINSEEDRNLLSTVIQMFSSKVMSKYNTWPKGFIHGDVNEGNVLVSKTTSNNNNNVIVNNTDTSYKIEAIIDFGDSSYSPYIFEISIAMLYLILKSKDFDLEDIPSQALKGYLQYIELGEEELSVIKLCICARAVQSIVRGIMSNSSQSFDSIGLKMLKKLWPIPDSDIVKRWRYGAGRI